jgi:protein-disulfide isomerase
MSSSLKIPLAIVAGGVIIAVAVYASMPKRVQTGSGSGDPALVRPISASDHILGNPAAKAMIVEYCDFDSEFCKSFDDTLHQIIASEGTSGEVAWTFREFPLTELHPNALSHAKAAECVAQIAGNDAFWKFKSSLFANQPVNPMRYGELAVAAGAPGDPFATCYASESASTPLIEHIKSDRQNALDTGAAGAPYSLIVVAGKPPIVMDGAYPYDAVKQLLDQALEN